MAPIWLPSLNGVNSEYAEVNVVWVSEELVDVVIEHIALNLAILHVLKVQSYHIEPVGFQVNLLKLPDDLFVVRQLRNTR